LQLFWFILSKLLDLKHCNYQVGLIYFKNTGKKKVQGMKLYNDKIDQFHFLLFEVETNILFANTFGHAQSTVSSLYKMQTFHNKKQKLKSVFM